jgi:hypothetical protein
MRAIDLGRERGGNCHNGPHRCKAKTWAQGKARPCEGFCVADNAAMTRAGEDDKKPKEPKQSGGRSQRLAAALRENLRRRKAQERRRRAPEALAPRDDKGG